ncbi:MAG TPA: hypothetical protein VGR76_06375 [Candidatus Angelobacter sp.]|nr:hypothetical protein [Candidatus Angelobacter sp.]
MAIMDFSNAMELASSATPETRLWQAVILSAVEDWVSGRLRTQQEAEVYLFQDNIDFPQVCESAGMNCDNLRSRLKKIRKQ